MLRAESQQTRLTQANILAGPVKRVAINKQMLTAVKDFVYTLPGVGLTSGALKRVGG